MKKIILIPLVVFVMTMLPSYSQENKLLRKAALATDKMEYNEALGFYDEALKENPDSYLANLGKGMVLSEFMERYEPAIPYLEKALKETPKDTMIRIHNSLGKCYQYVVNYPRAIYNYGRVVAYGTAGNPDFDAYLTKRIANCQYGLDHPEVAPASEQWIKNIDSPINTDMPEYGAVVVGNDLIFTSKRKDDADEKKNGLNGKYFESMYKTTLVNGKYDEPVRYTVPDLKGNSTFQKHNEAIISASADGKTVYVFRDGKIFEADMNDPTLNPNKMDKNINIAKYQNHACLTPDGNELYFVSESGRGEGGTDIYTSKKGSDGKWSAPIGLDMVVNTYFDEDAPFMNSDGTLFFSSNGLPGYGGFDVYKTHRENGEWTTPENLGHPINSSGDDIYFALKENSTEGFYSSSRLGGKGDIDIYKVHYAPKLPEVAKIVPAVVVNTVVPVEPKELKPIVIVPIPRKVIWDPSAVYFDFDKSVLHEKDLAILDYNITELKKNSEYTFTISGFADSRGTDEYNKNLSSRRAEYVKKYLVQNGISKNRITATYSLGESTPSNNCSDGVVCSEDQYQVNRRVDLKIINREKVSKPYIGMK